MSKDYCMENLRSEARNELTYIQRIYEKKILELDTDFSHCNLPPSLLEMKIGDIEKIGSIKYVGDVLQLTVPQSYSQHFVAPAPVETFATFQSTFLTDKHKPTPAFPDISAIGNNQGPNTNRIRSKKRSIGSIDKKRITSLASKPSSQLVNISNTVLQSTGRPLLRSTVKKISYTSTRVVCTPRQHKKDSLSQLITRVKSKKPREAYNGEPTETIVLHVSKQGTPLIFA